MYTPLIGSDPISSEQVIPNTGQLSDDSEYSNYFLDWKIYNPSSYKVLIPTGAYDIRVSCYASQGSRVGYVARVDGKPTWDYSGVPGCNDIHWNAAPWRRDNSGTLPRAAGDDWQAKKQDGTAGIVQHYGTVEAPRWLYLLPLVAAGSIHLLQISMKVHKAQFKGWEDAKKNAVVIQHPQGGRFIPESVVIEPKPTPIPVPPFPLPTPDPEPVVPQVELFEDLSLTIQECVYKGKVIQGPWTLVYDDGVKGWKLKTI